MMTMDAAIDAFAEADSLPTEAIEWVLEEWDTTGPLCRALLHDYVGGADLSERTERALYTVIHLLGERGDTRCFPDLCRLALDSERCNSVLGDDGMSASLPPILISTFDGDRAALHRLVETPDVDEVLRADTLLVLAYLARRRQFPEADMYDYLSGLTDRLQATGQDFVWFGWIRAVAALGFAGLSGRVEQILRRGLVDPALIDSAAFWADLRESQDDPQGTSSRAWEGIGPMGRTVEWLASKADANDAEAAPMEPIRNPMRQIGRNDPCPCGSGKKYKKCCLVA